MTSHSKLLFASAMLGAASTALLAAAVLIVVPPEFVERLRSGAALLVVPILVALRISYVYLSRNTS